jgi:hypothetical protein
MYGLERVELGVAFSRRAVAHEDPSRAVFGPSQMPLGRHWAVKSRPLWNKHDRD